MKATNQSTKNRKNLKEKNQSRRYKWEQRKKNITPSRYYYESKRNKKERVNERKFNHIHSYKKKERKYRPKINKRKMDYIAKNRVK